MNAASSLAITQPAMNTLFCVRFPLPAPPHAAQSACACFAELDRIEALLSRYRPDSDISRINALAVEESLLVDETTHTVLLLAMDMNSRTGGLFDITLGRQTLHRQSAGSDTFPPPVEGCLSIDPDRPRVTCLQPGRHLDLGGIGKGFALDRMAAILADLDIFSALLSAGASTHLAPGKSSWDLDLTGDHESLPCSLYHEALSSSGTGVQGAHILDPRGQCLETYPHHRVWTTAPSAAMADALSTAFLLLEPPLAAELAASFPEKISVFSESHAGEIHRLWPPSKPAQQGAP